MEGQESSRGAGVLISMAEQWGEGESERERVAESVLCRPAGIDLVSRSLLKW